MTLGGAFAPERLWSPWTFAARDQQITDLPEAKRQLHDTIVHCVGALASLDAPVVLKLSGGLDSSILAAALTRAGVDYRALNLVTDDPEGDERHYARQVAEALHLPLEERHRHIAGINLTWSQAAALPRPSARSFTQESDRLAAEIARAVNAVAIIDGGGGDNVFCSLQSVRPVIDAMIDGRGRRATIALAQSIAQLAQASQWTVLLRAWRTRRRGIRNYPWPLDLRLLVPAVTGDAAGGTDHPWLEAPANSLPGKAAHVALVAAAQSVAEGFDPAAMLPTFSPLIAQPVVEICLRIPSWAWFADGLNRRVARDAFADRLPAAVAYRRSKGGPDGFIAEVFAKNRATLRDLLLGGSLAHAGIIDRASIADALEDRGLVKDRDFLRILQLADAETWARCWL